MSDLALELDSSAAPRARRSLGYIQWLTKRLGISLITIALASVLVFAATQALPGDPALTMAGGGVGRPTPALLEQAREKYGLDEPVYERYASYVTRALQGDLGTSATNDLPVATMIVDRIPVTVELALLSVLFALVLGVIGGVVAAVTRGRLPDYAINLVALVGISLPNFWLGLMLALVFAVQLGWLPGSGFTPFWDDPIANLEGMVLPVIMLGTGLAAMVMRQLRSSMLEALDADYVRAARSKGLGRVQILFGHALRNCLIPLLTLTGLQLGALISGAVVAEQLFVLPGLGKLLLDGVFARDYAVVQAVALVMAVGYVVINFAIDLLYAAVDPRVRTAA
ncbi:ABC transporter permease [Conexibacter woesei]|uniref:Binding-protein-dependent transport systems inner membrane component n=1 Tax=Conexibacter woesei (strain DSM 14684 / CCUG 47730 / CIP 108061 / JCM 11494 / NBRC 100937 / ID131577) TaxID=469383 RepID=D3F6Y6_CONWI|nr:ABC transporter permease [Conexibacter woesei]ADB52784.1 binding-protein-dependent transport systems inner membrane component [Conexibacter woesei DSM 14684]